MDYDDLMEESECPNCRGNGYECRCTLVEIQAAIASLEEAYRKKVAK